MEQDDQPVAAKLKEYSGERDMERFWEEIKPRREPMQVRWFLPSVILLMVISVPWYLPAGFMGGLSGGLPSWIWVSIACATLIAGVTSYVALRSWQDDDE